MLLHSAAEGDDSAAEALWSSINDELRQLAASKLNRHQKGITLTPTVVLQEVYMRVVDGQGTLPKWDNRRHFFGSIARAMSQFLVDHARHRSRIKRGGDRQRVPLNVSAGELISTRTHDSDDMARAMDAFQQLQEHFPQQASVAWLRWVQGWTIDQIAVTLEIPSGTASNEWRLAQAWLRRAMDPEVEK